MGSEMCIRDSITLLVVDVAYGGAKAVVVAVVAVVAVFPAVVVVIVVVVAVAVVSSTVVVLGVTLRIVMPISAMKATPFYRSRPAVSLLS